MRSRRTHRAEALAIRLYRLALHLYPADFRRQYGRDMVQLFQDVFVRRPRAGLAPMARFLANVAADLAVSVAAEYWVLWRTHMRRKAFVPLAVGSLFLLHSFSFAAVNILHYSLGVKLPWDPYELWLSNQQPWLVRQVLDGLTVLGPLLALALFFLPSLQLRLGGNGDQLASLVILKSSRLRLVLIGLCLAVMGVFVLYFFAENFLCLTGRRPAC